jgi:hypothetical protein
MSSAELIRGALGNGSSEQASSAALTVLLDEVARYYWMLALLSGVSALACIAASVVSWRRRAEVDANSLRGRRMYTALAVMPALTAGVLLLAFAVGAYSALNPSDALVGLLGVESTTQ